MILVVERYNEIDSYIVNIFSWWFGLRCFFGGAGCSATSGTRGAIFVTMYVISFVGGGNLLRYDEGATWLAIVAVSVLFVIACFLNFTGRSCNSSKLRSQRLNDVNSCGICYNFSILCH